MSDATAWGSDTVDEFRLARPFMVPAVAQNSASPDWGWIAAVPEWAFQHVG